MALSVGTREEIMAGDGFQLKLTGDVLLLLLLLLVLRRGKSRSF
jgi:hypothetical protein